MKRHSIALAALLACPPALATDVALIGMFESKAAILSIDAGPPKTLKPGQSFGGVTLIALEKDRATVEIDGRRRVVTRGQTYSSSTANPVPQSLTLSAGAGGHFLADGHVNGGPIRFLVDTGASTIAIPASDAIRLRIDYRKGRRGSVQTAGGPVPMYVVMLESVRIGGIELRNIEAVVIERGLDVALLGNSFLTRTQMRLEGQTMTLMQRY